MARQTDFGAGEISPLLHSKTGAEFYARGLKACRNFTITKHGAAMSRPGTTYVGDVAGSPVDLSGFISLEDSLVDRTVLIPFIAADDESFVLVVQPNKIQLVTRGGYVESAPGTRYTIVTPYEEEDLRSLHYAQVGEVLTLVCPNWDAYEVRHVSDAPPTWTFARAVNAPYEPIPVHIDIDPIAWTSDWMVVVPSNWAISTAYALTDLVISDDSVWECTQAGVSSPAAGPSGYSQSFPDGTAVWRWVSAKNEPDADHVAREWKWGWTAVVRDKSTGELYETRMKEVAQSYNGNFIPGGLQALTSHLWAMYSDMPIRLRRYETGGPPATLPDGYDSYVVEEYAIYRGRGDLFGWIGSTKTTEFIDVGDAPDYATQPPLGTNPFGVNQEQVDPPQTAPLLSAEELTLGKVVRRYDRATAVAYFEQRRVFAGLTRREQDIVASSTSNFDNFDERVMHHIAGEALSYTIASRRRGRVQHLVTMDRLLVLTAAASYHVGGQPGTPGLDYDSVWMPLIEEVGANRVTPVVVDGACIFARTKGSGVRALVHSSQDGWKGVDVSQLGEHLFRGVSRRIIDMTYAEDPWGIIWVVLEDGSLLSLTYDSGREMMAWARHDMDGQVEAVCAVPEDDEDAVYLVVARTIGGVVHRYVERMTSRHERGGCVLNASLDPAEAIETPPDYVCVDSAVSFVGAPNTNYTVVTGLAHLEGKTVWLVGQGLTPTEHTVAGGQIDLGFTLEPNITDVEDSPAGPRVVAYVGLLYTPELELLPVAGGERTQMKQVTHVSFEVDNARGVLVAQEGTALDDQPDRDVQDGFGTQPLRTEVVRVPVRGTWDFSAGMTLRQSLPLPVTVIGLHRTEARGG